jgi:hypothetical protein
VIISVIGIIATKTASDAYLPILFPVITYVTALFFDSILLMKKNSAIFIWIIIGVITFMNGYILIEQKYFVAKGYMFTDRITAAKKIVSEADGRRYNLIGKGVGSQFESSTMNYEYLTWWIGNGPSHKPQVLQFIISEDKTGIAITKNINDK